MENNVRNGTVCLLRIYYLLSKRWIFAIIFSCLTVIQLAIYFLGKNTTMNLGYDIILMKSKSGVFYDVYGNALTNNIVIFFSSVLFMLLVLFSFLVFSISHKPAVKSKSWKAKIKDEETVYYCIVGLIVIISGMLTNLPGQAHGVYGRILQANIIIYSDYYCISIYIIFIMIVILSKKFRENKYK